MKNFFYSLIILAAIGIALYDAKPIQQIISAWLYVPCAKPITYSIGSYDPRFGLTDTELQNDIAEAAQVWNDALGKPLLKYDMNSPLKVNFTYDNRQQATVQRNAIDGQISSGQAEFNMLKVRYDAMSANYESDKVALTSQVNAYNQSLKAYNDQVSSWNARGGAPKNTFAELQTTKANLASEGARLDQSRAAFNAEVATLNSLGQQLNSMAKSLNINIRNYNAVGASVGEQFNEGEYIEDSSGKRINIYEFKNENQLVRVMEHEFGHALGLDHVDNPHAIMYYLNEGTNSALTEADVSALKLVCNINN